MDEPRVYVSHADEDRERVDRLLRPIRNLPIELALAGEELDPDVRRRDLEGQLRNSDLFLPVLTDAGASDPIVNQETGYAAANDLPVVALATNDANCRGYLEDVDATGYDPADLESTVFTLLTELRSALEPLGSLSTPNWFLAFGCSTEGCDAHVEVAVDEPQAVLWKRYKHEELLSGTCEECGVRYEFNPATLGYVRSAAPRQ